MEIARPQLSDHGLWVSAAHPGRADLLLGALDPACPFVLMQVSDGYADWHEATVGFAPDGEPRPRIVRHHSFDVLVTPAEAIEIGGYLHAQGIGGGGFACFQFRERPSARFHLPESPRARADALRGQGAELAIDLPHDMEVAVLTSVTESTLLEYVTRLS